MKNSFGNLCRKMLAEVSKSSLVPIEDRISSVLKKEPQVFDNLFGDKQRIIIPISSDAKNDFVDFLEKNGLSEIDLKKGIAQRKTNTQQGEKKQPISIGKFLQKLDNGSTWLDWWQKNKDHITDASKGVSIIISRNPIDIIRMSDHNEIQSCHSEGKSWFHCAIQEAKTGGAIAYVVKNSDIAKIKDLQAKEIFEDKKRNIPGIEPLERLRLRRFEDNKNQYLVPELRTYGIHHTGFYDAVKNWSFNKQQSELKNVDWEKIKLRGGSYQDNKAYQIWNNFTGSKFDSEKSSIDKPKEKGPKQILLQARTMVKEKNLTNVIFDVQLYDNESPFLMYDALLLIKFPSKIIVQSNFEHNIQTIKKEIANIEYSFDQYDIDYRTIDNELEFTIKVNPEMNSNNLEDMEVFLDYINDIDKTDYNNIKIKIFKILKENNCIADLDSLNKLKNIEIIEDLHIKNSQDKYVFKSINEFAIGTLNGMFKNSVFGNTIDSQVIINLKKDNLTRTYYASEFAKDILIKKFPNIKSIIITSPDIIKAKRINSIELHPADTYSHGTVFAEVYFAVAINTENLIETNDTIKEIDNSMPIVKQELEKIWENIKKTNENHSEEIIENIQRDIDVKIYNNKGKVYIKPTREGKKYYYKDLDGGIDMPIERFLEKLKTDIYKLKNKSSEIGQKIGISIWKIPGFFALKYKHGKPTFWLVDKDKWYNEKQTENILKKIKNDYLIKNQKLLEKLKRPKQ